MNDQMRVLMMVTSHDRIDETHRTGLWLEEFAVPYLEFRKAGMEVTVASTSGGQVPIDPASAPTREQQQEWAEASAELEHSEQISALDPSRFDAIFLPGGHGTMFDLPHNAKLHQILTDFDERGKIIAAVCHGPAAFVGAIRRDGKPLTSGRTITAFTDAEEREVKLDSLMPFLLESTLRETGATVVTRENWADHVVVDGALITGQNPQSSRSTAVAVVEALGRASA